MKKVLVIALVYALITPSCSKQEKDDKFETIFSNPNTVQLRGKPFNPITTDYTTRVVKIGYDHGSLSVLRRDPDFVKVSRKFDVDLSNITKSSYAYTPAEIIALPLKNSRDLVVVYSLNNQYTFALAKETELGGGFRKIAITNFNDPTDVYYEVQLSKQNAVGKFIAFKRLSLKGTTVSEPKSTVKPKDGEVLSLENPDDPSEDENGGRGCCSKPFGDCMNCLTASCSLDWRCFVVCAAAPVYCISAWMLACASGWGCEY